MPYTILEIRKLLQESDVDVRRAERNLKANIDDIHAWDRAHRVARRHGKAIRSTNLRALGRQVDYVIRVVTASSIIHYKYNPSGMVYSLPLREYLGIAQGRRYKIDIVDAPEGLFDL